MDPKSDPNAGQEKPPGAERGMRWDTGEIKSHSCGVATATMTPGEVVLNFGARLVSDRSNGELAIQLLRRISLSPLTAKHLQDVLSKVIALHDSRPRQPV